METSTMNEAERTADYPGLDSDEQRRWVSQVRAVLDLSPLVRPVTPNGLPMRVRVSAAGKLGWVGDGAYRYDDRDSRGNQWPAMPAEWSALWRRITGLDTDPDSAIINWYAPDASLGWHLDQAEHDRSLPIVTVSLGDACSWAVRAEEGSKVSRTRLESGAITLLAGSTRNYLHTVERIIAAPMFSPLGHVRGRVSVTMRIAGARP
jgi:alkylated DNA repair protein (DNA oxidative demethylase)